MRCLDPLYAFYYPYKDEEGHRKYKIRIIPKRVDLSENRLKSMYGNTRFGELIQLPCGHCEACKIAYRKDWSIRCEMESMFHKDNCFLTLTLDPEHSKPVPVKEDIQYFLHKLRDSYGIQCRYFACGELGSQTGRSHYHMILFGYKPDDLKYYGVSNSGEDLFTSKFLNKVWSKGEVKIGEFSIRTASYVAGYVNKAKEQSFLMESTHPGLGHLYMTKHFRELFKYGHYQGKNGQVHKLPRYFKKLCEKLGYDPIHIKIDNEEKMTEINTSQKFVHGFQYDGELNSFNGVVMKDKLKKLKRGL